MRTMKFTRLFKNTKYRDIVGVIMTDGKTEHVVGLFAVIDDKTALISAKYPSFRAAKLALRSIKIQFVSDLFGDKPLPPHWERVN